MANLSITDTSYNGTVASQFVTDALLSNQLINQGHLMVVDGIKFKHNLPTITSDDEVQDYSSTPVSSGTTVIGVTTLEPHLYQIYKTFDPLTETDAHWYSEQVQKSLIDRGLPNTIEAALVDQTLRNHNSWLDIALMQGDLTGSTKYNKFDGFITKAKADTATVKVTGTTLTSSNVIAELEKVHFAIPAAVKYSPNVKIFCSYASLELYSTAQIAQANKGVDVTQKGIASYKGIPLVALDGFYENCFFVARGEASNNSNLFVGLGAFEDITGIKVGKVNNVSELIFVRILMKVDTGINFGKETVLYI